MMSEEHRSERRARITQMPKVELHLHFEGAAPPAFIRGLAQEKNVDLSGIFNADGTYAYRDFGHFLSVYEAATQVLQTPEDFHRLTLAVLEESAAHGVIYSETFLSPDFCGNRDVGAWREYLAAIQEAAAQAERQHGIQLRGIVTCIRHEGPEQAKTAALSHELSEAKAAKFGPAYREQMGKGLAILSTAAIVSSVGLGVTYILGEAHPITKALVSAISA